MNKVLIITGGLLSAKDSSLFNVLKKQIAQLRYSKDSWLETKNKAYFAENLIMAKSWQKKTRLNSKASEILNCKDNFSVPELTEVVIATELNKYSIRYEAISYDDLFSDPKKSERLLNECNVVFASSTFLRDLSELQPLTKRLKRKSNKVVVGGALTGTLYKTWRGSKYVDVMAIGHGEMLIPQLAKWISSDFKELEAPATGRIVLNFHTKFLFSGSPTSLSLDEFTRPDWSLAEKYYDTKYKMIHYESVRGCPYRCAFCNYPYLFDDKKFRTKSAKKMADDWEHYSNFLGIEYITCLDSLFTMPKKRMLDFCKELIDRRINVKWICYARSSDLTDIEFVKLLYRAGCIQVQIGAESGNSNQLKYMNKRATVEDNGKAIDNCRKVGITTLVSFIIGFPGETSKSLDDTYLFIKSNPPDFYFLCLFSTRVPGVPILLPEAQYSFDLKSDSRLNTVSPYWKHSTMDCTQASERIRDLNKKIIKNKLSLDASIFYRGILKYRPEVREDLLQFQFEAINNQSLLKSTFSFIHKFVNWNLERNFKSYFKKRSNDVKKNLVQATN